MRAARRSSTSDDSLAIWSAIADSSATGGMALRSGAIGHNRRSCLRAALQGPARIEFRWRVSSQEGADYLHYIDGGQRDPARPTAAAGDRFLSGEVAWREASFDYSGGDIAVEWCYIKDGNGSSGDDAGFLDRLRITELLGSVTVAPAQATLPEGSSATFALSLDTVPSSNVTVILTVPAESAGDIIVSSAQVILSPGRPAAEIAITASEDGEVEARETHVVNARSPAAVSTIITVIISPDPLPQAELCAALDISEEKCPMLSTSDDSSAIWSASTVGGMTGDAALRSGAIGHNPRSCLRTALQGPARVEFRWRVSSQEGADYLHYIDGVQRNPETGGAAAGDRFLSGEAAWRDASFDYLGDGDIAVEWCYIKDGSGSSGEDAGFLDRLRITELLGSVTVAPAQVTLSEGESETLVISLDETLESNVTVNLTVPAESAGDIIVSSTQVTLSPGQPAAEIVVTANEDNRVEARETHVINARSPAAVSTIITVIISPDPLPQADLCAALDISDEDCPKFTFSTSDDSSAIWSASTVSGAINDTALRNEAIGDNQRSCLKTTLQPPVSVAFRWRVSSQEGADYLRYIDDGQRDPATGGTERGRRFLSCEDAEWRNASFNYTGGRSHWGGVVLHQRCGWQRRRRCGLS